MTKRICSFLLGVTMLLVLVPASAAGEVLRKTAEAAYGAPVIDGEIDSVWDKTNPNTIELLQGVESNSYKGWFKVLWDESRLYVLAKIYSNQYNDTNPSPWNNDSFEFFLDEKCDRTTSYQEDDYQLRGDFNGFTSGLNYDLTKLECKSSLFQGGYVVEMAFPLVTVTPHEGLTMGADVQVNASETLANPKTQFRWSQRAGNLSSNNSTMGTLVLKGSVSKTSFDEPEFKGMSVTQYVDEREPDTYEMRAEVKTTFDGKEFFYPILHVNEYPCMALEDLAVVIGGSAEGNTLIKDNMRLAFTEGSRLAEDAKGHILLERKPKVYEGRLYVPVSVLKITLLCNMYYNRFDNFLELTSGTNYPGEAEVVLYAKDFGAVGDGVHDDANALLSALHAAMAAGKPARLELEAGKTYLLGERVDRWNFFAIEDVENFTFEGNGSQILFEKPVNSFMQIMRSKNVKIKNMTVDYKELPFSQGQIISVDYENGKFRMKIDEGYPLPASDAWVKYYNTDARSGGWWFGMLMDAKEDRMKYTYTDHLYVDSVTPIEGRIYEIAVRDEAAGSGKYAEVGDRFVLNTRHSAYDICATSRNQGTTSAIYMDHCTDVEFDGVYVYATGWMFCGIGFSEGKTTFKNSGFMIKPGSGRLLCANSDGIHTWFNRGALIVENCTFMNNLDDQANTYNQGGFTQTVIDKHTFVTVGDMNARAGDEVQVYDQTNKKFLGRAFIKSCQPNGGGRIVTLDRDIEGVVGYDDGTSTPTLIYNMDSGSRGNVFRGNKYLFSRRHAILNRSANSLFEDNIITGCGGSGIAAENELTTATKSEGGFPCTNTIRNNKIEGAGNTFGYYPIEVRHWKAPLGASAAIDGVLIEGNEINVPNELGLMTINSVRDLYLLNNKLTSNGKTKMSTIPVAISNCDIAMIDGLDINYSENVSTGVTIVGCKVDEANIKNINIAQPNTAKPYTIE